MQNESKPTVERKDGMTIVEGSKSLRVVIAKVDEEQVSLSISEEDKKPIFWIVLSRAEASAIGEALKL